MDRIYLINFILPSYWHATRCLGIVKNENTAGFKENSPTGFGVFSRRPLRLGYVRLADAAPFIIAGELGIFKKYGLDVQLSREVGWATIRDKLVYGELDAAQALGPMPFAVSLGLDSIQCDCVSGLVLNLNGNAITLSRELNDRGILTPAALSDEIHQSRGSRTYTFGVVYPFSSHQILLSKWLKSGGINPVKDVQIVTLPPPQMARNLAAGTIDGYCSGDPWNSLSVLEGHGVTAELSSTINPGHPEKVLMVRKEFADYQPEVHALLIASLLEACRFCQDKNNQDEIISLLSHKQYLNCSKEAIAASFTGLYKFSSEREEHCPDFNVFYMKDSNEPTLEKANWVVDGLDEVGAFDGKLVNGAQIAKKVFRSDLYRAGLDKLRAV